MASLCYKKQLHLQNCNSLAAANKFPNNYGTTIIHIISPKCVKSNFRKGEWRPKFSGSCHTKVCFFPANFFIFFWRLSVDVNDDDDDDREGQTAFRKKLETSLRPPLLSPMNAINSWPDCSNPIARMIERRRWKERELRGPKLVEFRHLRMP